MALTNLGAPLTLGGAIGRGYVKGQYGGITSPIYVYEATPVAIDPNGIATSQAVAAPGDLTLDGALVTSGVATMDIPRNVTLVSDSGTDSTQVATVTGNDVYGIALVEDITLTGTSTAQGLKAFKTVSQVAIDGTCVGSLLCGSGDKFGLPYRITVPGSLQAFWDATWNSGSGTTTVGSAATATATTGDVRGTYLPATESDGTRTLALWIYMSDVDTDSGLYGVTQYGG